MCERKYIYSRFLHLAIAGCYLSRKQTSNIMRYFSMGRMVYNSSLAKYSCVAAVRVGKMCVMLWIDTFLVLTYRHYYGGPLCVPICAQPHALCQCLILSTRPHLRIHSSTAQESVISFYQSYSIIRLMSTELMMEELAVGT